MCKTKIFLSMFAFILLVALMTACSFGSNEAAKGVPDRTAELVVLDYLDEQKMGQEDYNSYRFEVVHNFDKRSNSDAAVINMTIEYNYASEQRSIPVWYSYDRASDLWALNRKGDWSDPVVTYYEDKLMGRWNIDLQSKSDIDAYSIEVKSVNGNSVTLDYSIHQLVGDRVLSLEGNGTFLIDEYERMQVIFDLPDGFSGLSGEDTAFFYVWVNPQEGCCVEYYAYLSDRPYIYAN